MQSPKRLISTSAQLTSSKVPALAHPQTGEASVGGAFSTGLFDAPRVLRGCVWPALRSCEIRTRLLVPLVTVALLLSGCDKGKNENDPEAGAQKVGSTPSLAFTIGPNTKGALYTWVDQEGTFQITDDPKSIPEPAQKQVRVVVDGRSVGSPEYVYVADLTEVSDGNYSLMTMPRSEWESLGKALRDKKVAALKPKEEPNTNAQLATLHVDAIIYGADWCKPCHLAEDYLKSKGAKVIKKDIEEDPSAAEEMRSVLKSAGLSGSSIPVLNVGGTILRGFSAKAIDAALARQKKQ